MVLLVAPDVPALHATADRLIVTMSDADDALQMAEHVIRHEPRVGESTSEVITTLETTTSSLDRVELIDVSYGQKEHGFDIGGHGQNSSSLS